MATLHEDLIDLHWPFFIWCQAGTEVLLPEICLYLVSFVLDWGSMSFRQQLLQQTVLTVIRWLDVFNVPLKNSKKKLHHSAYDQLM